MFFAIYWARPDQSFRNASLVFLAHLRSSSRTMRQKTFWILAAVVTASAVGLWIWHGQEVNSTPAHPLTVETLRTRLDQSLPVGSSRALVESYLDSQSIPHSYLDDFKFPSEGRVEIALIRGTSQSLFVRGDIQIRFRFDPSGRLLDYSLQEFSTGP
jgi:hypothetical protein